MLSLVDEVQECRIRQAGGVENEVVTAPQQAVEVKQVQDEVELVGCVVVNCCVVVCRVCLDHPELGVVGRLQVGDVDVVVVMVGEVDEVEVAES